MKVFTLGTDHRPSYDFTRLLAKFGIEVVFDVRPTPEAEEDYFCRSGLQTLCATQAADYVYLGNELGGPGHLEFRSWPASDEFKRGFSIIRNKLEKRVCCILCAERSPEHCHRRAISDQLAKQGIEVVHVLDEHTVWRPMPPLRPRSPRWRQPDRQRRRSDRRPRRQP